MPIATYATWSRLLALAPAVSVQTNKIPDVSIIIVNWNRLDDVLKNLHYLQYQAGVQFEVVVVDDGSTDGSAERLARVEGIKLVALGTNVGPCKARNIGIEHAVGRYILFLDSDAILSKWKLSRLVERMDQDSTIGILACTIINGATRRLDRWIYSESALTRRRDEFDAYSFSAAGAMVRRQALRAAGPFWDELFIYNEEVDLSIRVIRAGYRVVYFPKVRVYHYPSIEGRKGPGAYWRFQIRNWIWIFYRYYPSGSRLRMISSYVLLYIFKSLINNQVRACVAGILEGLTKTDIIDRYPDKLSPNEMRRIGALNTRTRIRLDR
jgi:GT2 family glycosyltransferase